MKTRRAKKKEPKVAPKNPWSAGKTARFFASTLREIRMGAILGRAIDPDTLIELVEVLEECLDASPVGDFGPETAEGLPEKIRELAKERDEGNAALNSTIAEWEGKYDDLERERDAAEKDLKDEHFEAVRDLEKKIDELRERAETAEAKLYELHAAKGDV